MKKLFVMIVMLVSITTVSNAQVTYACKDAQKGITEYIVQSRSAVYYYTSKNTNKIKLTEVTGDMMAQTYIVRFPNSTKLYTLFSNLGCIVDKGRLLVCVSPTGKIQQFYSTKTY